MVTQNASGELNVRCAHQTFIKSCFVGARFYFPLVFYDYIYMCVCVCVCVCVSIWIKTLATSSDLTPNEENPLRCFVLIHVGDLVFGSGRNSPLREFLFGFFREVFKGGIPSPPYGFLWSFCRVASCPVPFFYPPLPWHIP